MRAVKADLLRIAGFAGIAAVAAIRSMVSIEPNLWFADVDPARDQMPLLSLGAPGSHALDLALLLSAAVAILGELAARRGVRWGLVLLALFPMTAALVHGDAVPENGFRSSTWLAAMLAAVALAHLVRDRPFRAAALGVFLGVIALLAVRGFVQVLVEHPATVAFYEETRAAFLADRGWLSDSSAARTYERRLYQAEATGWFKLSNPFSTMMGVGLVGCGALAFAARRAQPSGNTLLLAIAAVASAVLLVVNGGKGALLATLVAIAVLVVSLRTARLPSPRWALVLAACALGAVFARWLVGTRIGEASLLFRGFYLEAGVRMLASPFDPASGFGSPLLLGLGADRVQEFFHAAKPPNCPEDVKSLHSIFADWFVALGLMGAAWIAVICRFFWSRSAHGGDDAGVAESAGEGGGGGAGRAGRLALATAAAAGIVGTVVAMRVEAPIVDGFWLATRLLGVFAAVLVARCAATAAMAAPPRAFRAAAFAIGVLVLVHAQIEMVAWLPGSCALALLLIACAAELPSADGRSRAEAGNSGLISYSLSYGACAVVFLLLATTSMVLELPRDIARAAQLERAARIIAPVRDDPAMEFELRMAAARELSAGPYPSRFALEASIAQSLAAALADPSRAKEAFDHADRFVATGMLLEPRRTVIEADIARRRLRHMASLERPSAEELESTRELVRAVERALRVLPYSPRRWADAGAAREAAGAVMDRAGVAFGEDPQEFYRRALEVNDALALDPLAQLSDREVAAIRAAIKRLGGTLE